MGVGAKMEINVIHKEMTDEEIYQNLKKVDDKSPFMNADEWKKLRKIQLKKEGKKWSI